MKKYLKAVFNSKILVLPLLLTSFVSQAIVVSNSENIGVTLDKITKKSRGDWSCWETNPTPDLSLFEGSFCGILKIAADPASGEDGYVGLARAYNKGLSAIGRYITAVNNDADLNWIYGIEIMYDYSAFGSYQLELIDEDWEYISIADQSKEQCFKDDAYCNLKATLPFRDITKYYKTEKQIYARAVVFGSKKSSSGLILKKLQVATHNYSIKN